MNFQKTILKNNLRLISIPMKETRALTLYFLVGTGSRYENKEQNGISHFLEHLFFKGTKKRPNTLKIAEELDGIGANYNAFTSDEMTGFYIQASFSQFERISDILFDILLNSLFEQKEIEKERGVIFQEINMRQDMPQAYVQDIYKLLLYGETPLGRLTIGNQRAIKNLKRQDFLNYKDKFYSGSSSVLGIAGKFSQGNLLRIKKYADNLKTGAKNKYEPFIDKQKNPQVFIYHKKTDQAHLTLGYKSISLNHPLHFPQEILNIILGASMSSRLFTELREKRGLCYYVYSDAWHFHDTGSLVAAAGVPINKIKEAIELILKEFDKMVVQGISSAELKKAKEYYKGKLALSMESSYNRAAFYANQELLLDKIETEEERIKKIEKVSEKDIKRTAQEIIKSKGLNLAIVGPFDNKQEFEKILA